MQLKHGMIIQEIQDQKSRSFVDGLAYQVLILKCQKQKAKTDIVGVILDGTLAGHRVNFSFNRGQRMSLFRIIEEKISPEDFLTSDNFIKREIGILINKKVSFRKMLTALAIAIARKPNKPEVYG